MPVSMEINPDEKESSCCGLELMWNQMMLDEVFGGVLESL
jgi:hypothetical protein